MKLTTNIRFCTFMFLLVTAFLSPDAHATVYRTDPFGFGGDWDEDFTWEDFQVPPNPLPVGDEIIITDGLSIFIKNHSRYINHRIGVIFFEY
jgi:hypothetical protein